MNADFTSTLMTLFAFMFLVSYVSLDIGWIHFDKLWGKCLFLSPLLYIIIALFTLNCNK